MSPATRKIFRLSPMLTLLGLLGCATQQPWNTSGSCAQGLVRLTVEYPKSDKPDLTSSQVTELAEKRCNAWGYQRAEEIGGFLRQCSDAKGNACELWKVTREFQCREAGSLAASLSR